MLCEVSGSVNINNYKFTHNTYYNNVIAIHYSSNDNAQLVFIFSKCILDSNERTSIVYFHQYATSQKYLVLQDNKGIFMYVLNHQLCIKRLVLFVENYATDGGGLYISDHAIVTFDESSVVSFSKNVASNEGGSIFISNTSMVSFENNSIAF